MTLEKEKIFVTKRPFISWLLVLLLSISPMQVSIANTLPSSTGDNNKAVVQQSLVECMNMGQQGKHCFNTAKVECVSGVSLVSLLMVQRLPQEAKTQIVPFFSQKQMVKSIYPELLLRPPIV